MTQEIRPRSLDPIRLAQFFDLYGRLQSLPAGEVPERLAHGLVHLLGVDHARLSLIPGAPGPSVSSPTATVSLVSSADESRMTIDYPTPDGVARLAVSRRGPFDPDSTALATAVAPLCALTLRSPDPATGQRQSLRGQALAALAHDIGTPLSVALGYASLLAEGAFGPLAPEQQNAATTVQRQMRDVSQLIAIALKLARADGGRWPVRREAFALAPLCTEMAEGTFLRATEADELQWTIAADLPALQTDRVLVQALLRTLIADALAHGPSAHVQIEAHAPDAIRVILRMPTTQLPAASGDAAVAEFMLHEIIGALGGRVLRHESATSESVVMVYLPCTVGAGR